MPPLDQPGTPRLHPRNKGFSWRRTTASGPLDTEQLASWDEEGFVVLRGVLDRDRVATVREELDRLEAAETRRLRENPPAIDISDPDAITFAKNLVGTSAVAREFALGDPFAAIAVQLLGPRVRLYWDQAVYKKPEPDRVFPWHQDNGYAFVEPQQYLTCWVPLVDADTENGCPEVMPGMHHAGTFEHRWTHLGFECLPAETVGVPAPARVGDVVCFSSLTPHRTGANRTGSVRKAYILQYMVDPSMRWELGADEPHDMLDDHLQPVVGG